MKILKYTGGGPDVISCGSAGQFVKGVARPVEDDELADQLLGKNNLVFEESEPDTPDNTETPKLPDTPAPDSKKPGKSAVKQLEG